MSVFSKYLGVASSLFETGQVETAVFRSGYGEYLPYGRFDPSMHRLLMTEAGDGLHCVLFHPGWQYRSFPLSCSVLDWGSTRSQSTAQSSSGWVRRTFVEPSSPSQFVLSHYHADHYNGLLRASWHSLNQGRWQQIDSIYGPGFPKIPRRQEFYAALFAVNLFLFGSYSGHMGFDFVSAIRRMAGHSRFKYKTLFKGDNFDLGTTSFSCLWPPRDLRSERLERRIGAAIAPFKKALEEHPGLNKLHDEVRDSKWFGKLLDGEENGLPPDVNTDEKSLSLEEQSFHGDLKIANSKLRGVANDLCLAFHHENQLLFLGDLSNGSLLELVKDLQAQSLINFRTLVAPHHGSIWEDCLTKLRAGHILVSNGPRLSPKFKSELNLIGSEVLSTHEKGDILADVGVCT